MVNSIAAGSYNKQAWEAKLTERLNKPTTWRDVADVLMADLRVLNVSYMSTHFSTQTGTRGSAYSFSDFSLTNETLTLSECKLAPIYIDHADAAQTSYVAQMDLAVRQASLLSEDIETAMLDDHGNWTDVGISAGVITSSNTSQITVSSTNIDDIVRGVRRIAIVANGSEVMNRNGLFFVWRAVDQEALEAFAQANGFNLADTALKNGIPNGYFFLGAYHYVSNNHATGHVFAGVRKLFKIGILKSTFGKRYESIDPSNADGPLSGTGLTARADFGTLTPTGFLTLLYDINVA